MTDSIGVLSESVQMYMVNILRLAKHGQPVPLSQLAASLDVSPVSANQMCRKLQDEGLVTYVPYKGVSITPAGEQVATRVLRRHRLWEVFLVGNLHMEWAEAHETACRLEHATPDEVIERLDAFLDHPRVNPQGDAIPAATGALPAAATLTLAELEAGQTGWYLRCTGDEAACSFLAGQGLRPGAELHVVAVSSESLLLDIAGRNMAVSRAVANTIQVEPDGRSVDSAQMHTQSVEEPAPDRFHQPQSTGSTLSTLGAGQSAVIEDLHGGHGFRSRLAALGFTPGTAITMVRNLRRGPIIVSVRDTRIALGRQEAQQVLIRPEGRDHDSAKQ